MSAASATRADRLNNPIPAIEKMDLDQLRRAWARQFGTPPPLRSPDLLKMMLGWRIQAHMHGGLDKDTKRKVRQKIAIEAEGLDLGTGTTITRQWKGRTYEIRVEETGFRLDGTLYPSLSAVARAITGTRWNGPRFFGMREKA